MNKKDMGRLVGMKTRIFTMKGIKAQMLNHHMEDLNRIAKKLKKPIIILEVKEDE